MLRSFWERWKRFGQFMGDIVGRVVLTLFYFTIVLPFGVGVRLFGDPLDIRGQEGTAWLGRSTADQTVEEARRLS